MKQGVVEASHLPAIQGDHVAMSMRHAPDESMDTESTQVIRHRSARVGLEVSPEQTGDDRAQVSILEALRNNREAADGLQEHVHARVAKA